jgi:hypothetical protein
VTYVGCVATGKYGDVKQIDNAMRMILLNSHGESHHPSLFEIQEIGIKVTETATGKVCSPYKNKVAWSFLNLVTLAHRNTCRSKCKGSSFFL